jgi:hypothetical protein
VLALYGHPDAGGFWEKHCDKHLRSVGFKSVHQSWMSVYFHAQLKLMLAVYVDDFKMSGPTSSLATGWSLISKHIKLEKPTPLGRYLGCHHSSFTRQIPIGFNPTEVEPSLSTLITEGNSTVTNLAKKDKLTKPSPSLQGGRVTATFIKYDIYQVCPTKR